MANAAFVGGRRTVAASNAPAGGRGAPRRSFLENLFQFVTLHPPRSRSVRDSKRCVSSTQSMRPPPPPDATGPSGPGTARSTSAAAVSIASLVSFAASAAAAPRRRSRSAAATSSALGAPSAAPPRRPRWDPLPRAVTVAATGPRPSTEKTQCSSLPAARQPSAVGPPVHAAATADRKYPASTTTPKPLSASAASQNAARSSDEGFWILSGYLRTTSWAPFADVRLVPLASFSISSRPLAKHDRKPRCVRIVIAATSSALGTPSAPPPPHAASSSEGRSAATSCAAARGDSSWNAGPASTAADANRRNRPLATASNSESNFAGSSPSSPPFPPPPATRSDNFAAAHDALATTRC